MDAKSIAGILDGRKTRTSRVIKVQPAQCFRPNGTWANQRGDPIPVDVWAWGRHRFDGIDALRQGLLECCPYSVGETVAITETWRIHEVVSYCPSLTQKSLRIQYEADADLSDWMPISTNAVVDRAVEAYHKNPLRWHPARFMPADFARLHARITSRDVGRIQGMTYDEIVAEGIPFYQRINPIAAPSALDEWWIARWDSINAKRGYPYRMNPWVYGYGFEVEQAPVDRAVEK